MLLKMDYYAKQYTNLALLHDSTVNVRTVHVTVLCFFTVHAKAHALYIDTADMFAKLPRILSPWLVR